MQQKYIVRNIHGGLYATGIDTYYPFIDIEDSKNVYIHDSYQDALDTVGIILSMYMSSEKPIIEIVPVFTK